MARRLFSFVAALLVALTALAVVGARPAAADPPEPSAKKAETKRQANAAGPGQLEITVSTPDDSPLSGYGYVYQWQPEEEYFDYYEYFEAYDEESFGPVSSPHAVTLDLPAGTYYVEFYEESDAYLTGFLNGADAPAGDLADDGVVTVVADAGTDAVIDLVVDPFVRTVTGSVESAAGQPVDGAQVQAVNAEGDFFDGDTTDADGAFELNLYAGEYILRVEETSTTDGVEVPLVVEEDDVDLGVITVPNAVGFTASGRVLDSDGIPVEFAYVVLYEQTEFGFDYVADVESEGGEYTFENVRPNRTYTVQASSFGYRNTWLGDTADEEQATTFQVTEDTELADITLLPASSVAGTVTGPDGPASDIRVVLYKYYDLGDEGSYFGYFDDTYTDEDGEYRYPGLNPGHYALFFDASDSEQALESAWLVGDAVPVSTDDPGVFEITDTVVNLDRDKQLSRGAVATGTIRNEAAAPIGDASVVVYVWDPVEESWSQEGSDTTADDGTFAAPVPANSTVTFRFAGPGYEPQFLGGGDTLPAAPDSSNSRTTGASGDLALGTITLAPFESHLGDVAGQELDYCLDNNVPANDDGSSEAVDIPFPLTYFGQSYDQLWVNNNGNVTFNGSQSQYTPSDLTGATDQPIIAPFFADVDTRGVGSNVVTYGASPDGNTFCVNWADVGYFSNGTDRLNTFQLLLTRNDTGSGRVAGDFDITFNYDRVQWETGNASGGSGGLGGTSAAVGFSAGTGVPGTYVQLPGSFVNGALIDGGANALISSSQNSSQVGRYVFQVRNDGIVSGLGNVEGTVVDQAEPPAGIEDAYVQICRTNGTGCSYTYTDGDGDGGYSFTALAAGDYAITVWPPSDEYFQGGAAVTVVGSETTEVAPIVLAAPQAPPTNVSINGSTSNGTDIPSVYYNAPVDFSITGCAGVVNPTVTVTLATGEVLANAVALTESPAGTYSVQIPPFYPRSGDALFTTNVPSTCGGSPVSFNVYIDPSGIVTDQYGVPIEGASVLLSRSDTEGGEYTTVPDGSDIMSPSNRANPSTTDDTGYFRWDVQVGWYKVTASATGCQTATTPGLEVPPERIDLVIKLTCTRPAPAPTAAPSLSAPPKVGTVINPVAATWPEPLVATDLALLRDGVEVAAPYTVLPGDVGVSFTVTSSAQRPDYVQENGDGETVTFSPVTATSTGVAGVIGDAPTATAGPTITGTPKVGQTLGVSQTWSASGLTFAYQWQRNGTDIADADDPTYVVTAADVAQSITVEVTASRAGYADGSAESTAVTVAKVASKTVAKLAKPKIKANQKGVLTVTVSAAGVPGPTGKVTVKDGKKVIATVTLKANKLGKLTIKLPKLKKGKHQILVSYSGDAAIAGSKAKKVTLKVT